MHQPASPLAAAAGCPDPKSPGHAELHFTGDGTACRRAGALILTCLLVHYLLWAFFIAGFIVLAVLAAGGSWRAAGLALALALAAYLPSYCDGSSLRLGRPWPAFRLMSGWRLIHEYANLRLVRTTELQPGRPYVFGWHPHGILILSRLATYGGAFEALFPGIETRALGATPVFLWPGSREISLWLGAVDASVSVAKRVLAANISAIVYPGGSKEIFRTDPYSRETVLDLRERTGFVRLAMQHGAPLVPVVVFGERAAYSRLETPAWLRDVCLRTLRVPVLIFFGRCCLLPHRLRLGVVFGGPIEVEHVPGIAKDDARVVAAHALYMKRLRELWEAHKVNHGYGADEVLTIR